MFSLCHRAFSKLKGSNVNQLRFILSSVYKCEQEWMSRLEQPLLQNLKLEYFFFELEKKHHVEGKISAIDADLFINKMVPSNIPDHLDELEFVINSLRRSPETIRTLPSTSHAVIRLLLDSNQVECLLQMLCNPLLYGIFPDYYEANLLMDTFLETKNFTAATRVAAYLMLQEDFGPKLTQLLALLSCYQYVTCSKNPPWVDYRPKKEEPVEEVKVRVAYIRNPYFDDHFDLTDSECIVGKTLAYLSPLIAGPFSATCELLGWTLYRKWDKCENFLNRILEKNISVDIELFSKVKSLIENMDETDGKKRSLQDCLTKLEASSLLVPLDISSLLHKEISQAVLTEENSLIDEQKSRYEEWLAMREEELEKQIFFYEKRKVAKEIEEKKKDLAAREEVIFFFDNKDKLELLVEDEKDRPRKRREVTLKYGTRRPRKEDEHYVPPEV